MLINSIDIQGGRVVQLKQGEELVLDAGLPRPLLEQFNVLGEVAVIDLDAAKGTGSNAEAIGELLGFGRCRVGGGIRTAEAARRWLDAGAHKVILGTAAVPEVLSQLPRERVIAALDSRDGRIVTHGWRTATDQTVEAQLQRLAPYIGGALVTFVETEGTLAGLQHERAAALAKQCHALGIELTIAGGVRSAAEVAVLDAMGADAQVGMAVYQGLLNPADAVCAVMRSDRPDGLWPTVVCDARGVALGLAYSNAESLRAAYAERKGVYWSRKRGLWRKGESSGNAQRLLRIDADCDRDALRFTVEQAGEGFCHTGAMTCWQPGGDRHGRTSIGGLSALQARLRGMTAGASQGSYTARLLADSALLGAKLREEAAELAAESAAAPVSEEAADLLYFAMVKMLASGVRLEDIERVLDARGLRLTRRSGDAKPAFGIGERENQA